MLLSSNSSSSSSLSSVYNSDFTNNLQELEFSNGIPKISTEQSSIDDNNRIYNHDYHDDQQDTNHQSHYSTTQSSGSSRRSSRSSGNNSNSDISNTTSSNSSLQIETLNKYEWNRICLLAFRTKNSEVPLESYREAFTEVFLFYIYICHRVVLNR